MADRFYPELNEKNFKLVLRLMEDDPTYINDPKCPYGQEIKDLLRGTPKHSDFDVNSTFDMSDDNLLDQIQSLFKELQEYGQTAKKSDNPSDQNTYFRLSVGLMEKLVTLKKEMSSIQLHNKFVEEVLTVMQEVLDADERETVMGRLRRLAGVADVEGEPVHTDSEVASA